MYGFGLAMALLSGVAHSVGLVIQKKVINDLVSQKGKGRFFASLLHSPLWVLGFIISFGLGTVFFLLAQAHLGPALIPGLMAAGLVVLIIGSIRILGEHLSLAEVSGILLLIAAIALLGSSRLTIDLAGFDVLGWEFLLRSTFFTLSILVLLLVLEIPGRRPAGHGGVAQALAAGLLFSVSNFWVGPFMGAVLRIFQGIYTLPVFSLFAAASAILVVTNIFGIGKTQLSFRGSDASLVISVQQIPVQVAPAVVYLAVFRLPPPSRGSLLLFCASIGLIIFATFLLAGRQGKIEEIRTEEPSGLE